MPATPLDPSEIVLLAVMVVWQIWGVPQIVNRSLQASVVIESVFAVAVRTVVMREEHDEGGREVRWLLLCLFWPCL